MFYPILWRIFLMTPSLLTYIYTHYYHMFSSNSYVPKSSNLAVVVRIWFFQKKKKLNTLAPPVPYLHHREHVAQWPSVSLAPALWYTSGFDAVRNGCSKRQVAKKSQLVCNLERHDIRTTWMIAPEPRKTKKKFNRDTYDGLFQSPYNW